MNDGSVPSYPLDGGYRFGNDVYGDMLLCEGDCATLSGAYFDFASCTFEGLPIKRHTITLGEGDIELDLRIGGSFASTEPGVFLAARGNLFLDAVSEPFEQTDYYKLVYNPEHHHFSRHFLVFFDEPIGLACGVLVVGAEPYPDGEGDFPLETVLAVDCEGRALWPMYVMDHEYEEIP